jgi:NADP-dependent 3-hydroxy acid dehydrogenase YdfG
MYSATKWAVTVIGYGVREELRGSGIRVTLIEPVRLRSHALCPFSSRARIIRAQLL